MTLANVISVARRRGPVVLAGAVWWGGKAAAARALESQVLPLLADGRVHVPVAATFPMSDATAAYERFAAGAKFGKVVLTRD